MNKQDEILESENRDLRHLVDELEAEVGIAHEAITRCAELLREHRRGVKDSPLQTQKPALTPP